MSRIQPETQNTRLHLPKAMERNEDERRMEHLVTNVLTRVIEYQLEYSEALFFNLNNDSRIVTYRYTETY